MSHSANASSTTNQHSQKQPEHKVDSANESASAPSQPLLTLPAPQDVAQDGHQLEVNGKDVKLDALGPVVVNEDGTMSRINNWAEMADIEKANVRRILLKRNEQRLKQLRAKAGIQQ
ncbi:hypothetical protein BGZ83_002189 [Gryganskiella cystojenkinii]|nr:hypothetical protein BGZ83_002189 [Gryganskiella cystojenkinii]